MKKKFYLLFLILGFFSTKVPAQSENKRRDTLNPVREIIFKKTGEDNFPLQLKKEQIAEQPAMLKTDSLRFTSEAETKYQKEKYIRHKKIKNPSRF